MTTMQGKKTTTPRGTETLELPRSLRGRLKYATRDAHVLRARGGFFSSVTGS